MLLANNPRMRPWITKEDKAAVLSVLDSADLMSGKQVQAFEEELAAYFGKRHAVCVASGTAALECAFVATEEGQKIHPDGFVAILSAARAAGYTPECSAGFGVPTSVLGVSGEQCPTRTLDNCHRFDKDASIADVNCYSFAPNKFIPCVGGCLVTNDSTVAAIARQYRNHGRDGGPEIFRFGRNLRMTETSAALGRSQLRRIDEILTRRKQVARWYDEVTGLRIADSRESWFLYPRTMGVPAPKGQRTMEDFCLFGTAQMHDRYTWLMPIWPMMTREDVEAVCK